MPPRFASSRVAMLRAAAADLLWGSRCVACGRPGELLCAECRRRPEPPEPRTLTGHTGDPLPVYAAGAYIDELAAAVPAYKERELRALAAPLGDALGSAISRALAGTVIAGVGGPGRTTAPTRVWLVPVPPSRRSKRTRGFVPVHTLARRAARTARRQGIDARLAVGTLRYTREVADQAGLGATDRAANLHGALAAGSTTLLAGLRRAGQCAQPVILVDDVVTTGATLLEAARALAAAGVRVSSAAVVADTPLGH